MVLKEKREMSTKTKSTRRHILRVARQVFAKEGAHNTTMNNIADLANLGRRTIYLYFKNKEELIDAVIETELGLLYKSLLKVKNQDLSVREKLLNFVYVHLDGMRKLVMRNGSLRAEFFRDICSVERARASFDKDMIKLVEEILREGVDKGEFDIPNIDIMAMIFVYANKGLEVPFISSFIKFRKPIVFEKLRVNMDALLFDGIGLKENLNLRKGEK